MADRQILDVVLGANEVVKEFKRKKKQRLVFKLTLRRPMITWIGTSWILL